MDLNDLDKEALVKHLEEQEREQLKQQQEYWTNIYPKLPLKQRKEVWLRNIWQDMLMQANAVGENVFYMLNRDAYARWKNQYADIDDILDFVLERLDAAHDGDGSLIEQLNRQLGRTE